METRPLGQVLRYLRQITGPVDGRPQDTELLERFVTVQDGEAFARLVERYGPLVLGVCRRVLHHHHDAEDAFQATFLVLARKARHIRNHAALAGWLYKVAYHLAVKLRTAMERQRRAERHRPPTRSKPSEDQMECNELMLVLDEEVMRLAEKYRAPLLLCCLAGQTRDEAAQQLGWTLGTLKMRLERGRQLLRKRLTRRGLTVSTAWLAMLLAQHAKAEALPAALKTSTLTAALLFAVGKTPAGLSKQAMSLAAMGLSLGVGKSLLLWTAALLLSFLGVAVSVLALPTATEIARSSPQLSPSPSRTQTEGEVILPALNRFTPASGEMGLAPLFQQHYSHFPDWHPSGATLLDIDGDGQLDLHLAGQAEWLAALGRNRAGRFAYVEPRPEILRGTRHSADVPYPGGQVRHVFDFNEDGQLDLAISWHNHGGTLYHNISRQGGLAFRKVPFITPEFPDIRASALADVNRDGMVDFLSSSTGTDISIHLGKEDGTFAHRPSAILPAGLHCAGAIPVDLDGDGQLELIARQTEFHVPARRKIFRNTGALTWSNITAQSGLREEGSVHGVGDLNQDGTPDLICVEGQQIILYFNDGRGKFTRKADAIHGLERATCGPHPEWGAKWGGAVVVDFDNDGQPDIIINGRFFCYLLRGIGNGTFAYANDRWNIPDFAYGDVDDGLCFGDVNGDGRLDIVLANSTPEDPRRPVGLFLNRVAEHPWLRVQLIGKSGNRSATGAKIRLFDARSPGRLLAYEQVAVWSRQSFHSYYATRLTERHFGLGRCAAVNVQVEFYPSGLCIERKNVPARGTLVLQEPGR